MHSTLVLILLVFLSLLSLGSSLRCFQCNSANEPKCADLTVNDTKSEYYKPCTGDYGDNTPFCRKDITSVVSSEESTRIIRTCGWIRNHPRKMDSCRTGDSDFLKKTDCICSTDGCNASWRSRNYVFLTVFNTISVVTLYRLIC